MGNRSYPKLVDGLESADDDGSVQGANRAISASLTADSIQKEPGKFVERTAWLFVIISCLDGLDSDLLFQLIKFFNYLHTFLDKPEILNRSNPVFLLLVTKVADTSKSIGIIQILLLTHSLPKSAYSFPIA